VSRLDGFAAGRQRLGGQTTRLAGKVALVTGAAGGLARLRPRASAQTGVTVIAAETVAAAVLELFAGKAAGEYVVIQPGRDPLPFAFRGVPGPR